MFVFYFPKNVLKSRSDKTDKFPMAANLKGVNEIYKNSLVFVTFWLKAMFLRLLISVWLRAPY